MKAAISAIYTRVSTENQQDEGTSLESQRQACLDKAKVEGYQVPENLMFTETYSGLSLDRPELTKLRGVARDDPMAAIIAYTPDRLCRNGEDILTLAKEFKAHGVKLIFVKEQWEDTLNGKLIAFILGWASEFEAAQIKERSSRGMRQRALSGKLFMGKGTNLYGYNYVAGKGEGEGIRYENPDQVKWVREIYRWYIEDNLPIGSIAKRLTSLGVPSPSRKPRWCAATVWNILKNEGYIGKTSAYLSAYKERIEMAGATPPILDETLFKQAQERLKRNRELASRNTKREYLLRGYVFCKICGKPYHGRTLIKRNGRRYEYYQCGGSIKGLLCPNISRDKNELDSQVWVEVKKVLEYPETVLAGLQSLADVNQENYLKQEIQRVNERLADLDREQAQLLQWALKGFPEQTVTAENKRINESRVDLLKRKSELELNLERASQAVTDIENINEALEVVRGNLNTLSLGNKRLALEALRVKIWIDKDTASLEGFLPRVTAVSTSPCQSEYNRYSGFPFCIPIKTGVC